MRLVRLLALGALLSSPLMAADVKTTGVADNWVSHNAAPDESAFSRLTQIDSNNVKRLGLA